MSSGPHFTESGQQLIVVRDELGMQERTRARFCPLNPVIVAYSVIPMCPSGVYKFKDWSYKDMLEPLRDRTQWKGVRSLVCALEMNIETLVSSSLSLSLPSSMVISLHPVLPHHAPNIRAK